MTNTRKNRMILHLAMGPLLMLCYPFEMLFSGNQNIYFLWGMAHAGTGSLLLDPMLMQADPFPLFSAFVQGMLVMKCTWATYVAYALLCSVYSYSIFGIADHLKGIYKDGLLGFTALFLMLHSSQFWGSFLRLFAHVDLRWIWDSGLAEQGVLRGYLQPSVFGVFLLLAVYRYLKNDVRGTFLSLAAAGMFHADYLFLGGMLGTVLLVGFWRKGQWKQSLTWSCVAMLAVMPYLIYTWWEFVPGTDEAYAMMDAAVQSTMPGNQHLNLALWLNWKTLLQGMVLVAFLLLFRKTRTVRLWAMLILIFGILSGIGFLLRTTILMSLNPWRISVVLIPVASMLVFWELSLRLRKHRLLYAAIGMFAGAAAAMVFFRFFGNARMLPSWRISTAVAMAAIGLTGILTARLKQHKEIDRWLAFGAVLICLMLGTTGTFMQQRFRMQQPEAAVTAFAKGHSTSTALYVVPTDLTSFRASSGCAIVADKNLIYGMGLPDQLQRIRDVKAFYGAVWKNEEFLLEFLTRHSANAILVPAGKRLPAHPSLKEVFRDSNYTVLKL